MGSLRKCTEKKPGEVTEEQSRKYADKVIFGQKQSRLVSDDKAVTRNGSEERNRSSEKWSLVGSLKREK